ncbi:MAG: 3-phosphoshikimate 1-carboxyvinyltransferase [Actinomycetota bacterium]
MNGFAVTPCKRVDGDVVVPGDKSISHRALLVAAMGEGRMAIRGISPAGDVASSLAAVRQLGVAFNNPTPQLDPLCQGAGSQPYQILADSPGLSGLDAGDLPIDVGNSGTTIRLLLGILAGSRTSSVLLGDASILTRPMLRVVAPLREMGANIEGEDGGRYAPLRVRGTSLRGMAHRLPVPSAQVKSCLLLAGIGASGQTSVWEPARSRDHTERMLRYLGVPVVESLNGLVVKSTRVFNGSLEVPGDLSSAAFLLVAAAILPGSSIRVRDVGVNPTRTGILEVLRAFGAGVDVSNVRDVCGEPVGDVTVTHSSRRAVQVAGPLVVETIDELPLVAVLGAMADDGVTVVRDAAELRVKESDRIEAVVENLRRMGVDCEASSDGFSVRGGTVPRGAAVNPRGDHRIAMAMAVLGLAAAGTTLVHDWGCVAVSYPGFEHALDRVAVR